MNNFRRQPNTRGAALLVSVVFFLATSLFLVTAIGGGAYGDLAQYRALSSGKVSFFASEAGIEDAVYRHRAVMNYSNTESFSIAGADVSVVRTGDSDTYTFVSEGNRGGAVRRNTTNLVIGGGASFGFGLQSGNGGLTLANSSRVYGNVFSNGQVTGSGNSVYGDIISAGPSGLVSGINATGTVWAHTITSSTVGEDAYYQTLTGTLVSGASCTGNPNCHPGSPDQATRTMPIADSVIEEWKAAAEAGGTLPLASCSGGLPTGLYIIDTNQTIGPLKIPCNLEISKNATILTLAGPVWVEGNITTQNGPTIQADPSTPDKGAVMIADNEGNRTTSSKLTIQGSTGYAGAAGDSYVLMVSMNNSAASGGGEVAMDIDNNTPGSEREVIYYAPYGKIVGRNSLLLRGATAHQISLANSAAVYYETGMLNPLFSGTGGSYTIEGWREVE